ncbi:GAF domain-containing sensor histidine kinase [Halorarius halobius]|uniref:GAF domain-containing sensor histidine kinase n=1 Tax=Halorarius halobius TaxID=2962671 RepID=UPI0020CDD276|nr:ATP-binding protein [Halorarius halobius]
MNHTESSGSLTDEEARSELYALLHQHQSRKQAIDRVVELGANYLGIEHGHITDIDEEENRWEVIGSTDSPDGPYPDGLTAKLSDSYCRRTIQQSTPLALHDAGNQGWADDPAYQLHQLDTYLGIRIDVFGEPYGTICFVDPETREEPFSDAELIFIELAGQVLRKVLEESQYEKDLSNRNRLISVLNRVLRHNLRNELNVVQGNAQLLKERTSGEENGFASTIESASTELLSLAEKSRELEELTRSVPVARPMDIVPLVNEAVTEVRDEHPSVNISLDIPEEANSFAAPQLSDAVSELLSNAAKHTGSNPAIAVDVYRRSDQTTVQIEDEGSGLPASERRILTGASETALDHGSGLGLALVYWIITNLDGEIDVTAGSSGTTVELHLQRTTSPSSK